MTAVTDWPYAEDGVKPDDPLNALRIPVITTSHPRWCYLVAFDQDAIQPDGNRPTDAEAAMLASFRDEYIQYWYNATWIAKMAARPFDIDGGYNGLVFRKWGDADWGYRRSTWDRGPLFWPGPAWYRERYGTKVHGLAELLDHINGYGDELNPRWEAWKTAHPDIWPVTS